MNLHVSIAAELNLPIVQAGPEVAESKPLLALIAEHRAELLEQLRQYGAILFRGFACADEEYFSQVIEVCNLGRRCDTSDYDLPRTVLHNDIYTSSDLPAQVPLPLHHEKPRSKNPPHNIYFCCVTPATQGGGTIFANAESIWQDMPQAIQQKILQHGVVYQQFFHGKTMKYAALRNILGPGSACSWVDYFATAEQSVIEKKLQQNQQDWQWVNQGRDLITRTHLPGVLPHPLTHNLTWFNSAAYLNYYANFLYGALTQLPWAKYLAARYLILKDRLPMVCHYGNGDAFSMAEVEQINQLVQKHTRVVNWQRGDFMLVDNYTLMHGKQAHEGTRLLYSCMTRAG